MNGKSRGERQGTIICKWINIELWVAQCGKLLILMPQVRWSYPRRRRLCYLHVCHAVTRAFVSLQLETFDALAACLLQVEHMYQPISHAAVHCHCLTMLRDTHDRWRSRFYQFVFTKYLYKASVSSSVTTVYGKCFTIHWPSGWACW